MVSLLHFAKYLKGTNMNSFQTPPKGKRGGNTLKLILQGWYYLDIKAK